MAKPSAKPNLAAAGSKPRLRAPKSSATAAVHHSSAALYRYSAWGFVVFALAVLIAFWPSYFSRLTEQSTYHPHLHGIVMTLWCLLLISQGFLIRSGKRALHRSLGKLSFVLVPLMVIATVHFLSFRVRGATEISPVGLYMVSLILNALVAFLILYGLAMTFRRNPAVHARYMVATIFPLFTPVTDRLIATYFPSVLALVPSIDGVPILPAAGFVLADVILAGLSLWDWKANNRTNVFPVALVVLVLFHISVLTFYKLAIWNSFAVWFAGLSLS